ncbi:MAG: hypothetical protein ACE5F6_00480 [Anaerolineae bacterium]
MKHKMTLGPAQICPECDGHYRVICECVPRDPHLPVEEMVGEVGCPECDGDGDHWCPVCMGNGAIRNPVCTCDENCDEPCKLCNRPTVQAARTAYHMGRKDARRYMDRSFGEACTDSATVGALASMLWTASRGATLPSQFDDLADKQQAKLHMVVREAMARIVEAARRRLDKYPDEPVNFEAIASAAEMEKQDD